MHSAWLYAHNTYQDHHSQGLYHSQMNSSLESTKLISLLGIEKLRLFVHVNMLVL